MFFLSNVVWMHYDGWILSIVNGSDDYGLFSSYGWKYWWMVTKRCKLLLIIVMRFVQISYDVYDGVDGCHLSKQCSKTIYVN